MTVVCFSKQATTLNTFSSEIYCVRVLKVQEIAELHRLWVSVVENRRKWKLLKTCANRLNVAADS